MNDLRALRRGAGLSQREFAELVGAALNSFRMWDSGLRPVPAQMLRRAREAALVHGCFAVGHLAVGRHWLLGRLPADDLDMKSRVHPKYKTRYHVANWPEYDQGLVQRGDVTLWLSADAIAAWKPAPSGRPGGQRRFSDAAIETALTLRLVFRLPLR